MASYLPNTRLASYDSFFQTNGDRVKILGAYRWSQQISSQSFLVIGDFEVLLRSQIHKELSQHFFQLDTGYWFIDPSVLNNFLQTCRHHINTTRNKKTLNQTLNNIKKNTSLQASFSLHPTCENIILDTLVEFAKGNKTVTPDNLIAGFSFGFWVTLFEGLKHPSHPPTFKSQIYSLIFKNQPQNNTSRNFFDQNLDTLYRIRSFRNRISHQDSIMRTPQKNYPHADFIPRQSNHMINSINSLLQQISHSVEAIDLSYKTDFTTTDHWKILSNILSKETLDLFKKTGGKEGTHILAMMVKMHNEIYHLGIKV